MSENKIEILSAGSRPVYREHQLWLLLFAAWLIALFATLSTLFIGEVMGQAPCNLCWFQRAFMFPLAIILAIASFRSDSAIWRYALPLSFLGGLIALYHNLLYFGFVTSLTPCGAGPSCSNSNMIILGTVPIPVLSLAAFMAITTLLNVARRRVIE